MATSTFYDLCSEILCRSSLKKNHSCAMIFLIMKKCFSTVSFIESEDKFHRTELSFSPWPIFRIVLTHILALEAFEICVLGPVLEGGTSQMYVLPLPLSIPCVIPGQHVTAVAVYAHIPWIFLNLPTQVVFSQYIELLSCPLPSHVFFSFLLSCFKLREHADGLSSPRPLLVLAFVP